MKRLIHATFTISNAGDFRKVVAIYEGVEGATKGCWTLYQNRGIKVGKFIKLDNYPCTPGDVTFENATLLLKSHGFLKDINEPENGY